MHKQIDTITGTKTILAFNTAILIVSVFLNIVMFSVLYSNEEQISNLQEVIKQNSSTEQQYNEAIQYIYNYDVLFYQEANEALLKYSEPKSINKAIKATPLPKLVKA